MTCISERGREFGEGIRVMISRERLVALLNDDDAGNTRGLQQTADSIRAHAVGRRVHLRALVEISSFCERNCLYCGLRKSNRKIARYRMTEGEIVAVAAEVAARGRRTIVLQAGEDGALTARRVARLVRRIKSAADVSVTLSLGEYHRDDFLEMREAGADRYLLKHETIDPDLYKAVHPGMSFEHRIRCLVWLKEAGFQVGSGVIVGLPGQTAETLADDIVFMRRLGVDMVGVGPFIPHADTPLRHIPPGQASLCLRTIALARISIPYAHIPATTAMGALFRHGVELSLRSGANVLMPCATPEQYRAGYDIYPNRTRMSDTGPHSVTGLLHRLGREVADDHGHIRNPVRCAEPFDITAHKRVAQRCPL